MHERESVLVFGAHPDDIEIGMKVSTLKMNLISVLSYVWFSLIF